MNIDNQELLQQRATTHSEIYLQSLKPTHNILYQAKSNNYGQSLTSTEWTQVFDLKDSALIVQVKDNELFMRIIHITEQPLIDFLDQVNKGKIRMPDGVTSKRRFLQTVDEQKSHLKSIFEDYSAAKIIADNVIIPNIVFTNQTHQKDIFESQLGFEDSFQSTQPITNYSLSFMTSSNLCYEVKFDRFYLKSKENVFVSQPILFNEINGYPKSFDIVHDPKANQKVFVIGTSIGFNLNADQHQIKKEVDETTLTLIRQDDKNQTLVYKHLNQTSNISGFFNDLIKKSMGAIVGNPINILGGQKRVTQQQQQPGQRGGKEEGVVSIKDIGNGMIAVVYTTGQFRVWSVISGKCIAEYDLLQPVHQHIIAKQQDLKLVKAKIQSIARPFSAIDSNKQFRLVVAYATTNQYKSTMQWKVDQFNMVFNFGPELLPSIDESIEIYTDLSNVQCTFTQHMSRVLDDKLEVTDIQLEQKDKKSYLWLATYNYATQQSQIQNLMSDQSELWSKEHQLQYEVIFDKVDLHKDLQMSNNSPYQQELKQHYYKRITKKGRLSTITLMDTLKKVQNVGSGQQSTAFQKYERPQSIKDQFKQLVPRSNIQAVALKSLLNFALLTEKENSKITGISQSLQNHPFRFIIRPIGISIIKEDSFINSLKNQVNMVCLELENKTRQPREVLDSSDLLVSALASIKYLSIDVLEQLDKHLPTSTNIRTLIMSAFRQSFTKETLNIELQRLIQTNRQKIEDLIIQMTDSLLIDFLETHAQKGDQMVQSIRNRVYEQTQYSHQVLKLMEQGLSDEIDSAYELLRDLYMLRLYIQINRPRLNPDIGYVVREEFQQEQMQSWLKQLGALRKLLKKDFSIQDALDNLDKSNERDLQLIEELKKQQQLDNQSDKISYLLYFILSDKSLIQQRRDLYGSVSFGKVLQGQQNLFQELLVKFVQKYTFTWQMKNQSYIPKVFRKLYQLKHYKNLNNIQLQSLINKTQYHFIFSKQSLQQKQEMNLHLFLENIHSCICQYHQNKDNVQLMELIIDKSKSDQILKKAQEISNNQLIKFYLIVLSQIKDLDERYQLFIIRAALQESILLPTERDYFNEQMFYTAQIQTSSELMFLACNSIINEPRRQNLIGQFLLNMFQSQQRELLVSKYFFSQEDIELGLQYLYDKIITILKDYRNSSKPQSIEWNRNVEVMLKVVNALSQLYNRTIQLCRFLLEFKVELDHNIHFQTLQMNHNTRINALKDLLNIQSFALLLLYVNALNIGDKLFITDTSEIIEPNNKRDIRRISNGDANATIEDLIWKKGYNVLELDQHKNRFLSGNIKRIELIDIRKALILTEARLKCIEYTLTENSHDLIKYLSELKEYDLAINLAHTYDHGRAYPIVSLIKDFDKHLKNQVSIDDLASEEQFTHELILNLNSIMKIFEVQGMFSNQEVKNGQNSTDLTTEIFDGAMKQILQLLSLNDQVQVAQGLISQNVKVPQYLTQSIVEGGLIKDLIEFYLSDKFLDFEAALDLMVNYYPRSVDNLAETDLQLFVMMMTVFEEALYENQNDLVTLKEQEQQMQSLLQIQQKHKQNQIRNNQFLQELSEFYGQGSEQVYYEKLSRKDNGEDKIDMRPIQIDITNTENVIEKLEQGQEILKDEISRYLNKQ